MKKYAHFLLLIFLFNMENHIFALPSSNETNLNHSSNDEAITQQVHLILSSEKDIPKNRVKIITKNGIVGIYGTVDTKLQANKIIEIVSSVPNVVNINTENLAIKSSKEFLSDAFITAKAKGKIKYLALSNKIKTGYELHVETTNGVVHILGTVLDQNDIKVIKNSILDIIDVQNVKMNVKCK